MRVKFNKTKSTTKSKGTITKRIVKTIRRITVIKKKKKNF